MFIKFWKDQWANPRKYEFWNYKSGAIGGIIAGTIFWNIIFLYLFVIQ